MRRSVRPRCRASLTRRPARAFAGRRARRKLLRLCRIFGGRIYDHVGEYLACVDRRLMLLVRTERRLESARNATNAAEIGNRREQKLETSAVLSTCRRTQAAAALN